jgi:SDR family mycofactocin-dependent oxidoreductase
VVTGAARGIGAAVALALAADGWALALGDVCTDDPDVAYPLGTEAELLDVRDRCRALGAAAVARRCDVRAPGQVDALVAAAAELAPVEAAVAVAGVLGGSGLAWELPPELVERDLDVNFRGVVNLCRAAVPHLLRAGDRGRLVAVVSAAGTTGLPRLASYAASKHAALGFIRSLAADLAPSGVTANAVLPGSTDTRLLRATAAAYDLASPRDFAQQSRLGRLLRPQEVASAVRWLCSAEASGATGAAVPVDGGFTG